jgi:hypothetical protein|nr:MAG TPA: hypothetical protein [Caudoviricetes sp.]
MKKYYLEGKEITEQEAKEIIAQNEEYMKSDDLTVWAKCQFITVVNL